MDETKFSSIKKFAGIFKEKGYIESGFIAVREDDGILITASNADLGNLTEQGVVFVNDKNIDTLDGNFRAAAVILFCAIRQDKTAEAGAIVDSDSILKFSSKRKTLLPILDDLVDLCGTSVKCAARNVAAEIVTSLSGQRNACFMPDAGAVIKGRSLEETFEATAALDKASNAELLAESKSGTEHLSMMTAFVEHAMFRLKTNKNFKTGKPVEQKQDSAQTEQPAEENGDAEAQTQNDQMKYEDFAVFEEGREGIAIFVRPYFASAVAAMGKPLPVPDEHKDRLGNEIPCAVTACPTSQKAVKNVQAVIGDAPACFIAQRGLVAVGKDAEEALAVCNEVEEACRAYFEK